MSCKAIGLVGRTALLSANSCPGLIHAQNISRAWLSPHLPDVSKYTRQNNEMVHLVNFKTCTCNKRWK